MVLKNKRGLSCTTVVQGNKSPCWQREQTKIINYSKHSYSSITANYNEIWKFDRVDVGESNGGYHFVCCVLWVAGRQGKWLIRRIPDNHYFIISDYRVPLSLHDCFIITREWLLKVSVVFVLFERGIRHSSQLVHHCRSTSWSKY